jgi:hypothetical protein
LRRPGCPARPNAVCSVSGKPGTSPSLQYRGERKQNTNTPAVGGVKSPAHGLLLIEEQKQSAFGEKVLLIEGRHIRQVDLAEEGEGTVRCLPVVILRLKARPPKILRDSGAAAELTSVGSGMRAGRARCHGYFVSFQLLQKLTTRQGGFRIVFGFVVKHMVSFFGHHLYFFFSFKVAYSSL